MIVDYHRYMAARERGKHVGRPRKKAKVNGIAAH